MIMFYVLLSNEILVQKLGATGHNARYTTRLAAALMIRAHWVSLDDNYTPKRPRQSFLYT